MPEIKICGLRRPQDILIANRYKPDFAGFIIDFPKSHRSISGQEVKNLRQNLDHGIPAVGVFVDQPVQKVINLLADGTIDFAQLHGKESPEYINEVQQSTGKKVIKAFEVKTSEDIERALESPADYLLLDQGKGGGETFDWSLITEKIDSPWFLAGGLTVDNLQQAIDTVHPWGVDISSGVETNGVKDEEKVKEVVSIVRGRLQIHLLNRRIK